MRLFSTKRRVSGKKKQRKSLGQKLKQVGTKKPTKAVTSQNNLQSKRDLKQVAKDVTSRIVGHMLFNAIASVLNDWWSQIF
jgi:cytochrome c551/c552